MVAGFLERHPDFRSALGRPRSGARSEGQHRRLPPALARPPRDGRLLRDLLGHTDRRAAPCPWAAGAPPRPRAEPHPGRGGRRPEAVDFGVANRVTLDPRWTISVSGRTRPFLRQCEAVHYRVSMPRPHSHLFEVEATFPAGLDDAGCSLLPVWTPGSYLVREYARHVQDVSARRRPAASRCPFERVDKRTWRVRGPGPARCALRYRVYANELTVRTSHLDGTHGYFNGATLFLYAEAHARPRAPVTVEAPRGLAAPSRALERRRRRPSSPRTTTSWSTARSRSGRTAAHLHRRGRPARGGGVGRAAARTRASWPRTCSASARPRRGSSAGCR